MNHWLNCSLALLISFGSYSAWAQSIDDSQGAVEITEPSGEYPTKGAPPASAHTTPKVGRKAAEKYMGAKPFDTSAPAPRRDSDPVTADTHYLAVHAGTFVSDNTYRWGAKDQTNVGRWNVGVTYRIGEWVNSMDMGLRIDLSSFDLNEGRATKISFLPVIMFPDASSKFPLYFGGGIGPGIFLNQIPDESSVSLDYQLFAGVRFFDVFRNTGFFVEAGLKDHFLLTSDGQFNGTYAALGLVFTF